MPCHPINAPAAACCGESLGSSSSHSRRESTEHRPNPQPSAAQAGHKRRTREADDDVCFICLDGTGKLARPCACPRVVHEQCLARWQLQQAGRREERFCRFCSTELKDWKVALTPSNMQPVQPVMVVTLGDAVHRIAVKPGPDGMREFQQRIRTLFAIPDGTEFEVTFRCKAPYEPGRIPADTIQLEGMSSYEAATHCASLMAAQRLATGGSPAFVR